MKRATFSWIRVYYTACGPSRRGFRWGDERIRHGKQLRSITRSSARVDVIIIVIIFYRAKGFKSENGWPGDAGLLQRRARMASTDDAAAASCTNNISVYRLKTHYVSSLIYQQKNEKIVFITGGNNSRNTNNSPWPYLLFISVCLTKIRLSNISNPNATKWQAFFFFLSNFSWRNRNWSL